MKIVLLLVLVAWIGSLPVTTTAFLSHSSSEALLSSRSRSRSVCSSSSSSSTGNCETEELGLLTFDLDDSLYAIGPVENDANRAFVSAMIRYGFEGLQPDDIVKAAKEIREEIGRSDPEKAAALTYADIRELAIRREMERITIKKKLQATAEDEATNVDKLAKIIVDSAKKWAKVAISDSMVKAVSTAWEMERHHSAERNLYPEVLDCLKQIRKDHPTAIIGAVVDGRSNPLFMTFTLAPYFDFSCSWEDEQGKRLKFFRELDSTGGETSQLTWLYDEARYKYSQLKSAQAGMANIPEQPLAFPATYDNRVWIHVGDDLAFDVGASKACGAKTVYLKLDETKYKQTARQIYDKADHNSLLPSWSTMPSAELKNRIQMAKAAKDKVDAEVNYLSQLPEVINELVYGNKERTNHEEQK